MPATVRDILLVIRAKEEASRAINNVTSSMSRAAAMAQAASARARAAGLRAQAQQASVRAEMLRTQAAQARVNGATKQQVASLQAQAAAQKNYARELRGAAVAQDKQAKSMVDASKSSRDFADRLHNVAQGAQVAGIGLTVMGAGGLIALKNSIDVASEWDKQVRLTFTQVDKRYKPSLQELGKIGLRVANEIATPFEGVQDALFDVFSSTEANLPQAEKLLKSFAKAAVAGQTDIQTVSRATIGLMNTYKIPFEDVNKVLDIQFQLVQEGVGTYEEWASRIGLVTPSAARAGQSIETMAAALSTATRTGMSAARAGTSVARAFDAISNPKTIESLAEIGVKAQDAKGKMRPLVDIMTDWKKALDKLPEKDRVKSILDTLKGAGSTIEARRFLQNILLTKGGLELFQDQIKEFATDKGAFQNAYNEMADSVSAKTQALHNSWMTLKLTIGQALLPAFSMVVGYVQRLVNWFNALPESTKQSIAQFALWGSIAAVVGGAFALLISLVIGLAAAAAAAGPALLPMIGTMAGVTLGAGALIAALAALGYGFVKLYQSSAPIRALVASIGTLFNTAYGIVSRFAMSVWNSFQTYVLPALQRLGSIIQTQVVPAFQVLVNWVQAKIMPIFNFVAGLLQNYVAAAFQYLGAIIQNDLIPAVQAAVAVWNKLWPVTKIVLMVFGAVAAVIGGAVVASIISMIMIAGALIQMLIKVGRIVLVFAGYLAGPLQGAYNQVIGGGKRIAATWNLLAAAVGALRGKVVQSFNSMIAAVRGALSGFVGTMSSIGANLISGLIGGIRSMAGAAVGAAKSVVSDAIQGAKNVLGIHSPSRVFRDIGRNTIQGMINGITGSRKALVNAMVSLTSSIMKSIDAAKISKATKKAMESKWAKKLSAAQTSLLKLYDKRTALQNKLKTAEASYNAQLKERADLYEKIRDQALKSGDLTSLSAEETTSAKTIADALQGRLAALSTFQTNLNALAARGLDKQTIADLAAQGVEAAGSLVTALVNGSAQDLQRINQYEAAIRNMAESAGNSISDSLYKQGINAAKGLVDGLNSQIKTITASMTSIANALVKQIKKELGIKSPSRVMGAIGRNTALGYINEYKAVMNRNLTGMAKASLFTPASGYGTAGRVALGSAANAQVNQGKTIHNNITVHTQEIDPRKTSADLGWELAGKM